MPNKLRHAVRDLPPLDLNDIDVTALDETLEAVVGLDSVDYFAPENQLGARVGREAIDVIRWLRAYPEDAAALGIGVAR